jgi:hypothetical protein
MRFAVVRFIVAVGLFLGWVGWLAYLAATTRHPVVLSRPQLLAADVVVIADIDDPTKEVTVTEVPFFRIRPEKFEKPITVANLAQCEGAFAFARPGLYIVPLHRDELGRWWVQPVPVPSKLHDDDDFPRLRIYPVTAETRAQLERSQLK